MVFKAILRLPLCEVYLGNMLYTHYLYTYLSFTHSFIHSSIQQILPAHFLPGTLWGIRNKTM